jgi:hypothetical protein
MDNIIEITLTTFLDFVIKVGPPKITCVKKAKQLYSQEYNPTFDYWGSLRKGIVDIHKDKRGKESLDQLLQGIALTNKRERYNLCIKGYKKFMGKKDIEWLGSSKGIWRSGSLMVKVNPELGLRINGKDHMIKLYFKSKDLPKTHVLAILHLINSITNKDHRNIVPGILDVQNGHLITQNISAPDIEALLIGEASAFTAMWNTL